jgi:phage-related minor tail protein
MMENFPAAIDNQRQTMELLSEQFKTSCAKTQEFVDLMKKMPEESMRQTDTLISINRQLGVSADTDIVLNENFVKFNATLEKLSQATESQTESVVQMSKTFAASDRYLKYLVDKQNKRFMLVFFVATGVCVLSIIALVTVIALK